MSDATAAAGTGGTAETQAFEAFSRRRQAVADLLRKLRGTADRIGAKTLATRLGRELVDKLDEDRFNLVVVGEFNHGKTSLVNALLALSTGEGVAPQGVARALPVGVTPTTAVIHHVSWAEAPRATLVHVDGRREDVSFEALARYGALGGEAEAEREDIGYIDVGYPAEILRDRIVLVDTPGVNDLCLQRADVTYKYIPQSDAVLFVIDAGQPLKESERLFLKDKLIGQSRDKIIFVVTKVDIWSEAERAEALDYVASELQKLVPTPIVYPVSPARMQQGAVGASGMPELVRFLRRYLAEERGRILLDNALGEGLEACRALARGVDARRRAARMSAEELGRRIERIEGDLAGQRSTLEERRAAVREAVAAIRAWVRRDLDRFCDDVIRQLPEVVDKTPVDDLKQHFSAFLEATFARWAEAECEEIARALEELGERTVALMREDAHETARRLGEVAGAEVTPPPIQVDTFAYDVGVFALFSVGVGMLFTNLLLGGLLTIAAPVLAMYLKDRVEVQTRAKAKELAATALREAAARVAPKLDEMIEGFRDRLDAWLVAAGRELHQELIDVLAAMQTERTLVEPDAERQARAADALDAELGAVRDELAATRAALWQPAAGEVPAGEVPAPGA
ncbi:MAG: dynamin family protein [Myxococcales bacterium]|nr:dynamin family protein [Myxococcales bacterium]